MDTSTNLRKRLYTIIFEADTEAGQRFDRYLLVAILASLVVVMLDSIGHFHSRYHAVLDALEWGFTGLFAVEYGLRLYSAPRRARYALSFFGLIDLFAWLPAILALFIPTGQYLLIIRVIRMMRVFRVLKLSPYLRQANFLLAALQGSQQKITVFFVGIASFVTVFGTLMYVIEGPANGFTSIPKGIYWAIVTLTTVGFGDIVPRTAVGQALASLVMIAGYSVIAVPTGIFTAELANVVRTSESRTHLCPGCDKQTHDAGAAFCSRCGSSLYSRLTGGA